MLHGKAFLMLARSEGFTLPAQDERKGIDIIITIRQEPPYIRCTICQHDKTYIGA